MMDQLTSDLVSQIHDALMNDARTRDESIDVINENGIITLRGRVRDRATKDAAEQIAQSQPGVMSVVNELDTTQRV